MKEIGPSMAMVKKPLRLMTKIMWNLWKCHQMSAPGADSSREQGLQSWPPDITSKGGPCTVRYNRSMVIVTWRLFLPSLTPPHHRPLDRQTEWYTWKHCLPATSFSGGNKTSQVRLGVKTYLPPYRQKGRGMKGSRDSKFCLDIHFAYVRQGLMDEVDKQVWERK